jgi:hypothetical protein
MAQNLRPAGRENGPGYVLIMHYVDNGIHYYRISCSTVPDKHQAAIEREEKRRGNEIKLKRVYTAEVNEMLGAKAAVKIVLQGMGLTRDANRGTAQDWFWGTQLDIDSLKYFADAAVEAHNSNHPTQQALEE